jgi:hypothetical protein
MNNYTLNFQNVLSDNFKTLHEYFKPTQDNDPDVIITERTPLLSDIESLPITPDGKYISFRDPSQSSSRPQPQSQSQQLPKVLTHQLYLDIRRREPELNNDNGNNENKTFLDFTDNTYNQHFKSYFNRSWICTKSSFYFFIQSIFPNAYQHVAPDLIINLSEDILDEYSTIINNKAMSTFNEDVVRR